jgi:hypothetical protein|tara:strand:- start:371 stop:772 length:402 start_codon:yes stop_codon:yes gene_type:complete
MNLSLPVTLCDDWPLQSLGHAVGVLQPLAMPLTAAELLSILRERWGASYDLQLHRRAGRLYLQVMWAYLEQQSFPLSEEDYVLRLEQLVEQLNGIGQAEAVRNWLQTTRDKPRLGKALSFPLPDQGRLSEFLL